MFVISTLLVVCFLPYHPAARVSGGVGASGGHGGSFAGHSHYHGSGHQWFTYPKNSIYSYYYPYPSHPYPQNHRYFSPLSKSALLYLYAMVVPALMLYALYKNRQDKTRNYEIKLCQKAMSHIQNNTIRLETLPSPSPTWLKHIQTLYPLLQEALYKQQLSSIKAHTGIVLQSLIRTQIHELQANKQINHLQVKKIYHQGILFENEEHLLIAVQASVVDYLTPSNSTNITDGSTHAKNVCDVLYFHRKNKTSPWLLLDVKAYQHT